MTGFVVQGHVYYTQGFWWVFISTSLILYFAPTTKTTEIDNKKMYI